MNSYDKEVTRVSAGIDVFFQKSFDKIVIDGPLLDCASIQKHPLMAVSTHRSHIDYFMFGLQLHKMGFQNLRFAAGDNLTKLPYIGPRFKAFGAFTVERDTGFERNYVRNLCSSVVSMMENRDVVIVFPEGGRSYSGATLEIKGGVLGAAILTQAMHPDQEVYYIPGALSYEYLPDLPHFKMLLHGKKLRKKSNPFVKRLLGNMLYFGGDILAFGPFMTAPKFNRKYGSVYLDYSSPVSIKQIIDIEANRQHNARDEFSAHRASIQQLSQIIYKQLKSLYRILPMHVVSYALTQKNPLLISEAKTSAAKILESLQAKSYNCKFLNNLDNSQLVELGINQLLRFKAISASHGILSIKKPEIVHYFSLSIENSGD